MRAQSSEYAMEDKAASQSVGIYALCSGSEPDPVID
jgi:hypothetical protein